MAASEGIPALSRTRTLFAKFRDACLSSPVMDAPDSSHENPDRPDSTFIQRPMRRVYQQRKSEIPERSRDCSNLLPRKCLRVPTVAVRGFWSRMARIMLIIAE